MVVAKAALQLDGPLSLQHQVLLSSKISRHQLRQQCASERSGTCREGAGRPSRGQVSLAEGRQGQWSKPVGCTRNRDRVKCGDHCPNASWAELYKKPPTSLADKKQPRQWC